MSGTSILFGGCLLAGLLGGPSCSAGDEDLGERQQALLCQSVDVCDDHDPCTDDLCVASLCVNLPLINCSGGNGGGAGDDGGDGTGDGGALQHGGAGPTGGSSGNGPVANDGGNVGEPTGGGADAGGTSNSAVGATNAGGDGTSQAGHATVATGDPGAAGAGKDPGRDADADAWRMQGGGCAFAVGDRASRPATAWALLSLLLVVFGIRRRRPHPRRQEEPYS